jgi:hypothetical protein
MGSLGGVNLKAVKEKTAYTGRRRRRYGRRKYWYCRRDSGDLFDLNIDGFEEGETDNNGIPEFSGDKPVYTKREPRTRGCGV